MLHAPPPDQEPLLQGFGVKEVGILSFCDVWLRELWWYARMFCGWDVFCVIWVIDWKWSGSCGEFQKGFNLNLRSFNKNIQKNPSTHKRVQTFFYHFPLFYFIEYFNISALFGGFHLYDSWKFSARWSSTVLSKTDGFSIANGELYTPGMFFVDVRWCRFFANAENSAFASYLLYSSFSSASAFPISFNYLRNYSFFLSRALSYYFLR